MLVQMTLFGTVLQKNVEGRGERGHNDVIFGDIVWRSLLTTKYLTEYIDNCRVLPSLAGQTPHTL